MRAWLTADLAAPFKRFEDRALGRFASIAIAATILAMLACWLPQYLTWPWWNDHDHFGTFAMCWDAGGPLPYRDLPSFQFPGEYYLYWAIGKVFGWGRTMPLYAVDAATLVLLIVALAAWSRRRCGRILPGLIGALAFTVYYLGLGIEQAAQRDWHATLLFVLALLTVQSVPGRSGRFASAILAAMALSIRPHVALLLPGMALAIDESARAPGESLVRTLQALVEWGVVFAAGLALAFAPVLLGGLWGDFLRGLRIISVGGAYNKLTTSTFGPRFWKQFDGHWGRWGVPLASILLAATCLPGRRRLVGAWGLAILGSYFYKPLSPVEHHYLNHHLSLIWSVNLALLAMVAREVPGPIAPLRLATLGLLVVAAVPAWPSYADPLHGLQALPWAARGEMPAELPACGFWHTYSWSDYRKLIAHLRHSTSPETSVANALVGMPAVDAVVGRRTPMPGESLAWFRYFDDPVLRASYAERLAETPDSVAVWVPAERGGFFPEALAAVIEERYTFEAKFGPIEVWRRRPASRGPRSRGPQ